MTSPNTNTFAPQPGGDYPPDIPELPQGTHIAVIGAGAFGGWSAYFLNKRGYRVTLIDGWGPGNSRSSSGDETRVIRSTYGNNATYFDLNVRALQLWQEHQTLFGKTLFTKTGVLWFCYEAHAPLVDDSIAYAEKHAMPYTYLSKDQLKKSYPLISTDDLHHAYFDPFGGYLAARDACAAVAENFVKQGGAYVQALAKPATIAQHGLTGIALSNGDTVEADLYLFACGSWLGSLFPDVLSHVITCTKQEVYYFGTPSDRSMDYDNFPVWIDLDGSDFYYGIPGNKGRGFKIGVDKRGRAFDPTNGERLPEQEVLQHARAFIGKRFPGLANAPLVESRVCPYENSPDGNFLFDVHPHASNVLFLGGGSGHGFKHGPALGELVSDVLAGHKKAPAMFTLRKK